MSLSERSVTQLLRRDVRRWDAQGFNLPDRLAAFSRKLVMLFVAAGFISDSQLKAQDVEERAVLQIDVHYVLLDPTHDLSSKLDEDNLVEEILEKQFVLTGAGAAIVARKFSLTTLAGEKASIQLGRRVAVVTGQQIMPNGQVSRRTRDEDVGTLLQVEPRLEGELAVLHITFEATTIVPDEDELTPDTRVVSVVIQAPVVLDSAQVVYDVTEEGDAQGRSICIARVRKVGVIRQPAVRAPANEVRDLAGRMRAGGGDRAGGFGGRPPERTAAGLLLNRERADAMIGQMLERFDSNNNGELDPEEVPESLARVFDANKDGKVTSEEIRELSDRTGRRNVEREQRTVERPRREE